MTSPAVLKLFVVLMAGVIGVTWCDVFHVTVDNVLTEVCVNGIKEQRPPNYDTVKYLDHIQLPAEWNANGEGCIAVQATNTDPLTAAGILGCVTSDTNPTAAVWNCAPRYEVGGCCSSCSRSFWNNPSTSRIRTYKPNQRHNKDYIDKLPDQCTNNKGDTEWVWDKHRKQPNVCCILRECANLCKDCSIRGPGYCDPGKCLFGPTGLASALQTCSYKCCVDMTVSRDDTQNPKFTITNKATHVIRSYVCEKLFCLVVLNVEKCDIDEIDTFDTETLMTEEEAKRNLLPKYKNLAFFDLEGGSSTEYYPWITVAGFKGTGEPEFIYYDGYKFVAYATQPHASFCATGYQGGTLTFTEVVTAPQGT